MAHLVSFPGTRNSRESKRPFPNSRELKNPSGNDNSRANVRGERVAVRRAAGKLFHMTGPATAKLLLPSAVVGETSQCQSSLYQSLYQPCITCGTKKSEWVWPHNPTDGDRHGVAPGGGGAYGLEDPADSAF